MSFDELHDEVLKAGMRNEHLGVILKDNSVAWHVEQLGPVADDFSGTCMNQKVYFTAAEVTNIIFP